MVLWQLVANSSELVPVGLEPVADFLRQVFSVLSAVVGGLFGLYVIFIVIRFVYDRKILNELRSVKAQITKLRNDINRMARRQKRK
jgi:hypothetical protein